MVSISLDKKVYDPYMPTEVLTSYATDFAKTGDLSKRINVTPGSIAKDGTVTPFSFQIMSDKNNTIAIWDSKDHPIFLSQYLMTWGGSLLTGKADQFTPAFGLGERVDDFWLKDGIYSFWNRNMPSSEETEHLPAKNGYGTHPYIAWRTPEGTFASKFVMNVAANDIVLESDTANGMISFDQISVGGSLELYVSEARDPETLVKQYHQLVGAPSLPPQWMLGWHQAKYGYKTLDQVKAVVSNYAKNKIPLESVWNDVNYMDSGRDFTIDADNYKGLGDYVIEMHKNNQKYVPIVNAGVAYTPKDAFYKPYNEGLADKVFINEYSNMEPFLGESWGGQVVYPDWTNSKTAGYW